MSELGEMLRSAREAKGISLSDASRATRIRLNYLEALELGEYSALPGFAYVTGFLRNYAKLLDLHPDDVVQEFHALRPPPPPAVRPATRVLASGRHRELRTRILWIFGSIVFLLGSGFAIKAYNGLVYAQKNPDLQLTPSNLGATLAVHSAPPARPKPTSFHLHLRATASVWVRVTVDGHRRYDGILKAGTHTPHWLARRSSVILTYNGSNLRVFLNGRPLGSLAATPGLIVEQVTSAGLRRIS